jgi:NADPH:quinone reductase-like Zn-dependent oxidoreductase
MKAIRYHRYGPPDVLELADVEMPAVGDDEMLVRVRAAEAIRYLETGHARGKIVVTV